MKKHLYTAAAIGIAACAWADDIQFSNLPKSVQSTINGNLNGGVVQDIEIEARNGRTLYDVEIRREGPNTHLQVDADGKILEATEGAAVKVDGKNIFDKNDGKILGVVDNPNDNDAHMDAEARVGDKKVKVEGEIETPQADRHRNDAHVDVDADMHEGKVVVETNAGKEKRVFNKTDGKLLGFIPWFKKNSDTPPEVVHNTVTTDANGGLDTDKNDGRILGVPKRGFETLGLQDVPAPVRNTINQAAGGARIAEIELAEENGRQLYEVDIERDGKNRELHIAADGTIVKDTDPQAVGRPGTTTRGSGHAE